MKMKRIAVIGLKGLPAFGGAAAVGENIIEQLMDQYDFTVYSISSHTDLKTGEYNGFKQIVFNKIKNRKLNTLLYYIKAMFGVLFGSYDLVHLHHRDAAFIIPLLRLRTKVILTTHGMVLTKKWVKFKWLFNLQDRFFLGLANSITTVSLKDFRLVAQKLKSENKTTYIPNGVNLQEFSKNERNNTIVFAAGRIVPDKGCHTLLKALIQINFQEKVLIIGDLNQMPAYKEKLKYLSSKLNDAEFKGLIKDKETLNQHIGSAKLFVYPSEIESMSMMMLEVASLKTPMICANIPENKDVFSDEEILYFENSNSDDLARKIEWAQDNYLTMQDKAEKSYSKLKSDYQWEDIAKKYASIYDKLI